MTELGAELLELAGALVGDWLDEAVPPEQAVRAIKDAAPRAVRDRSLRDIFSPAEYENSGRAGLVN